MTEFPFAFLAVNLTAIAFIIFVHLLLSFLLWKYVRRLLALLLLAILAFATTIGWTLVGGVLGTMLSFSQENFPLEESPRGHVWLMTGGLPFDNLRFVLVALSLYLLGILFGVLTGMLMRPYRIDSSG